MSYVSTGRRLGAVSPAVSVKTKTAVADQYLEQVTALKGQQKQLEDLLKKIQAALRTAQARATMLCRSGSTPACQQANTNVRRIQSDIVACKAAILACASKADNAVAGAVANGATTVDVVAAKNAGTSAAQPGVTGGSVTYQPAVMPGSAPVSNVGVETKAPTLLPGGVVLPSPNATLTTIDDAGEPETPDVSQPQQSSGHGTVVALAAALVGGYLVFKKK